MHLEPPDDHSDFFFVIHDANFLELKTESFCCELMILSFVELKKCCRLSGCACDSLFFHTLQQFHGENLLGKVSPVKLSFENGFIQVMQLADGKLARKQFKTDGLID